MYYQFDSAQATTMWLIMPPLEQYPEPTPPFNLSDREAIKEYHAHLQKSRYLAQCNGLKSGQCFSLSLAVPPSNPHPLARSLPNLSPEIPITIRLAYPLQFGSGINSQVWTAVVELAGAQTTLVFKVIQPSLCHYPAADGYWKDYWFPEHLAHAEAWAYDHLTHKQGLYIPYFFGIHKIITPSNETAWALVLEYIPGETMLSYIGSPTRSLADTCDLLKLSIDTLTEFMNDGWCHNDLTPRNIIVTGEPGSRRVVFIDLDSVCHFPPEFLQEKDCHRRRHLYNEICDSLGADIEEVQRWAAKNMDLVVVNPRQYRMLNTSL